MDDFNEKAKKYEWSIRAGGHIYVTLYHYGKFVFCYDNDMEYAEKIIASIEKRTHIKINEVPLVDCSIDSFSGFRFVGRFANLLLGY